LNDPSRYEESVSELLQSLMSGKKKLQDLDSAEKQMLDNAVVDFSTVRKPAEPVRAISPKVLPKKEEPEEPPPTVDGVKPFWWV